MGRWEGDGGESVGLQENASHLWRPLTETALAGGGGRGCSARGGGCVSLPSPTLFMPVQAAQGIFGGRELESNVLFLD